MRLYDSQNKFENGHLQGDIAKVCQSLQLLKCFDEASSLLVLERICVSKKKVISYSLWFLTILKYLKIPNENNVKSYYENFLLKRKYTICMLM